MHSTNDCGETQNISLRVRIEHSKQRSSKSKQAINDKEKARRKGNHTAAEVPISWALMLPIALFHFWLSVDLAEKKKKKAVKSKLKIIFLHFVLCCATGSLTVL